mmetsp:Transcript_48306/g.96722  ORF Transcript_48306/g.96722 Transcript_48306/m.96722 type:complete len:200 (-) Transcript_48306:134-733(-)
MQDMHLFRALSKRNHGNCDGVPSWITAGLESVNGSVHWLLRVRVPAGVKRGERIAINVSGEKVNVRDRDCVFVVGFGMALTWMCPQAVYRGESCSAPTEAVFALADTKYLLLPSTFICHTLIRLAARVVSDQVFSLRVQSPIEWQVPGRSGLFPPRCLMGRVVPSDRLVSRRLCPPCKVFPALIFGRSRNGIAPSKGAL